MPHFTFIASVMLQYDDTGFSLKQLINEVIRIENIQPSHKARLLKVLHDADESVLDQHKYLMDYTSNNIRFFNASVVPRFDDVKGVTKAEYDSDLEFCESIDNNIFIQSIINEIEVKDD